jgi:hypothetical protein
MVYSLTDRSLRNAVAGCLQQAQIFVVIAVVRPVVCSRNFSSAGAFFDGVAI